MIDLSFRILSWNCELRKFHLS
uniref:Uncharacterized protein n=1 Tax=Rhizophora mucronata TaxID=61149 RepID=A0A2P2NA78_RHIMU